MRQACLAFRAGEGPRSLPRALLATCDRLSAFQRPPTPYAAFQRPSTQHPRTLRAFQTSLQALQVSLTPCIPRAIDSLPSSDHPLPTQPSSNYPRSIHVCCTRFRRPARSWNSYRVHLNPKQVRYDNPGDLAQQQQPCDALRLFFHGLGCLLAPSGAPPAARCTLRARVSQDLPLGAHRHRIRPPCMSRQPTFSPSHVTSYIPRDVVWVHTLTHSPPDSCRPLVSGHPPTITGCTGCRTLTAARPRRYASRSLLNMQPVTTAR
ncbi:hypothetical protein GGX14DRAFT_580950 [Mycena pura]|uniref:Uncharacterized protein n=1 Tax=Mycena pura TaxID=153505 RepID=A0AAD6XX74_9AGAR|nr:hypothetical protein GGX14DRAFT_580950 [Mycena pura]